ncbi:Protein of unknown function [Pyronema omphalodes CBS 100304]|uniref:Uncharacterized protein n=1 Tax=Pyronema omphalodes (strain CBS 100304) TaxID=1076935 RepID=U4LP61_PYROM|nr:Protein of unknown function [Pyronema omphalodes CBS 100304]
MASYTENTPLEVYMKRKQRLKELTDKAKREFVRVRTDVHGRARDVTSNHVEGVSGNDTRRPEG